MKPFSHSRVLGSALIKTTIIGLFLLSLPVKAIAPSWNSFQVISPDPYNPYKELECAVAMIETFGDTMAYNPLEEAYGLLQIREVRLIDYNNRTHHSYSPRDLFNVKISEEIFFYYADMIGPYNIEKIARRWNGCGQQTDFYWERVKELL
jgi:hypothetical protein